MARQIQAAPAATRGQCSVAGRIGQGSVAAPAESGGQGAGLPPEDGGRVLQLGIGNTLMPSISRFFGVVIYMYFNDHSPPYFHAEYGESEAVYVIEPLDILRGQLPRRAHGMVIEWALAHRDQLRVNWDRARSRLPLEQIEPLE
jgi:hypothetical protein